MLQIKTQGQDKRKNAMLLTACVLMTFISARGILSVVNAGKAKADTPRVKRKAAPNPAETTRNGTPPDAPAVNPDLALAEQTPPLAPGDANPPTPGAANPPGAETPKPTLEIGPDPFKPTIPPKETGKSGGPSNGQNPPAPKRDTLTGSRPAPTPVNTKPFTPDGGLPPLGFGPASGGARPTSPAAPAAPPPPPPTIRLLGTLIGNPSLATLEVNGQPKNAQVGDLVAEHYVVAEITEGWVRLRRLGKDIPLKAGEAINEETAKK